MNEKQLFDELNKEAQSHVPDVYGKVLLNAKAEGLLDLDEETSAVYSDGDTVVLGGVNKKGIAITTLASLTAICLTIALPIALSSNQSGIPSAGGENPPVIENPNSEVNTLALGDDYAIGAVSTAKLAESFLAEEESGARSLPVKAVSLVVNPDQVGIEKYISEFDNYYYACNSFFGEKPVDVEYVENHDAKYDNSIVVEGKFSNGDIARYSMYYTEARILDDNTVTGDEVKYYLEGYLYLNGKNYTMYGERVYTDSSKEEVKSLSLTAYPVSYNKNSRVDMSVEYGDNGSVKKYSFAVVKNGDTISESVLSFPDKTATADNPAYVIEFNGDDGEREGQFTVNHPQQGWESLIVGYEIGNLTSEFRVKATASKIERVLAPDGLVYTDNGDGTYKITGYDKSKKMPKELILPNEFDGKKVVKITSSAFSECKDIEKVIVPEGITEIGEFVFDQCTNLNQIILPETLTDMGVCVFGRCTALKSIELPKNLVNMESQVFYGCTGLTEVKLPENLEILGRLTFQNCANLKTVTIPSSVKTIGYGVFSGTAVETINLGANDYYYLDGGCLLDKATKTVWGASVGFKIPDGATAICQQAFAYCDHLTELTLPASVKKIESLAFERSTLKSIVMPGVEEIGMFAFTDSSIINVEFSENLKTIETDAFSDCYSLTALNLPASLNSIGLCAFVSCYSLQSITVATGNPVYYSSGNCLIKRNNGEIILGCSTSVIPDSGVSSIGSSAFSGQKTLTAITIPSSVTRIGYMAFNNCSSLTSIVIPDSVTVIDSFAFYECFELSDITLPSNLKSIGACAFVDCYGLKNITIPDSVTDIGEEAFSGCDLASVKVPAHVETVSKGSFKRCAWLQSVTISSEVKTIEEQVFYGCSNLTEINFTGTTAEWLSITKGDGWDWDTGNYTVICSDGTLDKAGNLI